MQYLALVSNGSNFGAKYDWAAPYAEFAFERGKWYKLRVELKANLPNIPNAIARLWVNDVLLVEKIDFEMRPPQIKSGFNNILFGGWYSNGGGRNPSPNPAAPSTYYIDDAKITSLPKL